MARDRLAGRQDLFRNNNSFSPPQSTPHYELSRMHRDYTSEQQIGMSDDAFYTEITDIQDEINKLNANVDAMSRLHALQIDAVELSGSNLSRQLDALTEDTRALSYTLRGRIQVLNSQRVDARVATMRGPHIERVRDKFKEAITRFQTEEKSYRDRSKDRMARQYMIVKPDASPEEVQAVVESGQNIQIFAQATTGARYAQAQSAYNAVRDRHEEIRRIEVTLAELGQLLQDMSLLVEQQGDMIDNAEAKAGEAQLDIEKGEKFTLKARISALSYRKGRWICFGLSLIIVVVIAVAVTCGVSSKC